MFSIVCLCLSDSAEKPTIMFESLIVSTILVEKSDAFIIGKDAVLRVSL